MKKMDKCVIIGVGLIGGSIGKALIEKDLCREVVGLCRRKSSLDRAVKAKSVTSGYVDEYEKALFGADIVIVATPVYTIKSTLKRIAKNISKDSDAVVTDVGSTKKEIMSWAEEYKELNFIGGHPIAGSEKKGVEHARPDLFEGSVCVLCETDLAGRSQKDTLKEFWRALGAEVFYLSAEEHDRMLAFTSHLPHAVSFALCACQRSSYLGFASTGFKDTTRLAGSDPVLWKDIFLSNPQSIVSAINDFQTELLDIKSLIERNDQQGLINKLSKSQKVRDEFDEKNKSCSN